MPRLRPNTLTWCAVIIICVGALLRLHRVMALPMFTDEVLHLARAHNVVMAGDTFDGLEQNKWLYVFTLAQFNPTGPEGPWLARYLTVLFAAVSMAGCITLGRLLDNRLTGAVAGVLYALLPMAVFHERQALVDPMMVAFGTLTLVASLHLAHRPRWWLALPLTLSFAAALLTKPAAAPYLVMPLVALIAFGILKQAPNTWRNPRLAKGVLIAAVSIITAVGLTLAIYQIAAVAGTTPHDTHTFRYANTGMGRFGLQAFLQRTPRDIGVLLEIGWKYAGPAMLLFAFGAVIFATTDQHRWQAVLFLLVPAVAFALVPVLASRPTATDDIATRYLLPNTAAFVVLAAIGLTASAERFDTRWALPAALLITVTPMIAFNRHLYQNPPEANLTTYDYRVYITDTTSGYRYQDVVRYFMDEVQTGRVTGVGHNTTILHTRTHLGPRLSDMHLNNPNSAEQRERFEAWWAAQTPIYIVEWLGAGVAIEGPNGTTLEHVYTTESWQEQDPVSIYRVIEVE